MLVTRCPRRRLLALPSPYPSPRLQCFAVSVWERQKSDLKKFRAIAQVMIFTLELQLLAVLG